MDHINVTINGKKILTKPGKTILEVINENNIDHIPTLCHDERIEPYGSCFLCVVEVKGLNKLVPSCSTPVNDGMDIITKNDKIINSRKTALELLLSNHYADCIGPCINNCPANVDAQGYIALISIGKYKEALKLIKESNPLPLSIGRVCVRNCEDNCRRCLLDDPVSVNSLKRFVADKEGTYWKPEIKEKKKNKIAIIGGGPAGLTCAYYLLLEGYQVTIFEKLPKLGGMLRYGIPEYRLPKATLDEEIKWITDLGTKVKNNAEMGKDFTLDDLKKQGFDSVFLGAGAHKASKMRIEGEDTIKGIYTGIDFLREFEIHGNINLDGIVIVVGGGNTAIDAARTSLRCGASKVKIVYRRSIKEMPAHFAEVEAAQKEGVEILFLTNPKSIISENNKIKGIVCYKMRLEEVPGERPRPIEIKGSEFIIHCDYLISAIGQQVDNSFIVHENNCKLEKWGTICVNETTYETSIPGVFAAGDVVSGPLTAVNAIGQGKKAAIAINSYIKTGKAANKNGKFYSFKHKLTKISPNEYSHLEKIKRIKMPELPINERINNFKEVELGLNEVQAENETLRCLECGCSEYYDCELIKYANDYHIDISDYIGDVRKFKIDDSHPFIKLDPNKCINCGKCVRTCSEILKISALGFINRGFKAVVKPAMEKPLIETNCISCGNCIDVCPTGAISEKYPFKVLGTLPKTNHISICNFCSLGCSLNFKIIDDDIIYVSNNTREILNTKNNGYLCIKGKFGHRYLTENLKLEFPSVKENGELKKTTQDEAISFTAKRLKEIIKKYGRDSIAVFGSPKWANEELYLLQKFARIALHTNNISSFTTFNQEYDLSSLDDLTGVTVSTISLNDIEKADIIVVINSALSEENLLIELKIKKAQKKGAKLILINSSEIKLTKFTDLWVDSKKATNTVLLNGIIKEVSDLEQAGLEKLKKMVAPFDNEMVTDITGIDTGTYKKLIEYLKDHTKNIVFIYHAGSLREKSKNDLKAIGNFLSVTNRLNKNNNGLIILRDYSNSQGLLDMGVDPNYLPGYIKQNEKFEIKRLSEIWGTSLEKIFKPANLEEKLLTNKIKAVLIFGEDPLAEKENLKYFRGIEFIFVMDSFLTDSVIEADVTIPASTYFEKTGTLTSCDTQIQKINQIIQEKNNFGNLKIISKLAGKFDVNLNYNGCEEILNEIKIVNRFYKNIQTGDYWIKNLRKQDFFINPKNKYLTYAIDLTTYNEIRTPILFSEQYFLKKIRNKLI